MPQHKLPAEPAAAGAWYRQPVLWLGAAIFIASLAGCVWMIVLGARHADLPLEDVRPHTLLGMPVRGAGNGEPAPENAVSTPRASDRRSGQTP
jgi:hypothetical protein